MAYDGKKHSVVYTSNLSGKCLSLMCASALDNGMLVSVGAAEEGERELRTATFNVKKEAYLICNPAWQYDDSDYARKYDESCYYNAANKPVRGYKMFKDDRYEVSSDICTEELSKDDYVVANTDGKLKKAEGADNADNAFVGQVDFVNENKFTYNTGVAGGLDVASKFYVIRVVKNEDVASPAPVI